VLTPEDRGVQQRSSVLSHGLKYRSEINVFKGVIPKATWGTWTLINREEIGFTGSDYMGILRGCYSGRYYGWFILLVVALVGIISNALFGGLIFDRVFLREVVHVGAVHKNW